MPQSRNKGRCPGSHRTTREKHHRQHQDAIPKQLENLPAKSYAEAAKKIDDQVAKIQTAMSNSTTLTEAVKEIKCSSEKQCDKIKGMEETIAKRMAQQSQVLEDNASNIQKVVRLKKKKT